MLRNDKRTLVLLFTIFYTIFPALSFAIEATQGGFNVESSFGVTKNSQIKEIRNSMGVKNYISRRTPGEVLKKIVEYRRIADEMISKMCGERAPERDTIIREITRARSGARGRRLGWSGSYLNSRSPAARSALANDGSLTPKANVILWLFASAN